MARTPLFSAIKRSLTLARLANRLGAPPAAELIELARASRREWTRRRFLGTSAMAGLALGVGCAGKKPKAAGTAAAAAPPTTAPPGPRVAIVGAGIAGLNAAHHLKRAGVAAVVYEASKRSGGRMFTAHDLLGPGLTTELGGEFIDSGHEDMRALVEELGLELLDTQEPAESAYIPEAYLFAGQMRSEREVVEAFRPVAARIEADLAGIEEVVDFEHEGGALDLDRTPLSAYIEKVTGGGWLQSLLEVAFVTEYGLDAGRQSALNLLFLIGTDLEDERFRAFGDSDERFKVKGGNQRVVDELARRLDGQVKTEHRLLRVSARGEAYGLAFSGPAGATVEVTADVVILALPFTLLREVDLALELPPYKKRAIAELGYGTNAKLLVGLSSRPWRSQGHAGNLFSDEAFQLAWDNSRMQPGTAGGLTLYSGGTPGIEVGKGTVESQVQRLLPGVDKAFPGVAAAKSGKAERFHWPTYPFTKASYACYQPGQWTTICGAEGRAVGRLLFAGEHTSVDFQGYMNGGAESGRRAAEEALALLGLPGAAPAAGAGEESAR